MKNPASNNNNIILIQLVFTLPLLLSHSICHAASQNNYFDNMAFSFKPTLLIEQLYTDNLTYSEANRISTWGTLLSPSIKLGLQKDSKTATIHYQAHKAEYYGSSSDDYLDHQIQGKLKFQASQRTNMQFFALYGRKHEARGTGYSIGIADQLSQNDELREYQTGTVINYGSPQSIGRIELKLNAHAARLDNRPGAGQFANQNNYHGSLAFFYQLKTNTLLFVEANSTKNKFNLLNGSNSLNNLDTRVYAGTSWDATALTTGTFKLGVSHKRFSNKEKGNSSGFVWDLGVRWHPLQTTWFDIATQSHTEETSGNGDYVQTTKISSTVTHQWLQLLQTSLNLSAVKDTYQPTDQEQGTWHIQAEVNYQIHHRIKIGASITHQERLSTKSGHDFKRNIGKLSLSLNT